MAVESNFKNYIDLDLSTNKQLQQTISQRDTDSRARLSFKTSLKERHRNLPPKSRNRTISAATITDNVVTNVADLLLKPNRPDEKNDRRYSDLKSRAEHQDQTGLERHNSNPQLHFNNFVQHVHRNHKHNHRTPSRDDTNPMQTAVNSGSASPSKIDPPFALKSPTLPMRTARLSPTMSNGTTTINHNDDLLSSFSSLSFILEENSLEPRLADSLTIESHAPICVSEIYHEHFFEHFHTNYYGEYDDEGPFIASIRCSYQKTTLGEVCEARAIIRTQSRNCDVSDIVTESNENNILQMLFNKTNLPPIRSYGTIGDPKANEKIYQFDKTNDERYSCKIGVIYQRAHQKEEYEIFSNDYASADMLKFLDTLAERVRLKGFAKYRGDLDTKGDLHGEFSFYTGYSNHEIMFNVAPLVPSSKANGQCVERKGLVGNAFVCIVFQESGAVFLPDYISGKVTQVYITVQPLILEDGLYYKVGVWRRNDITTVIDPPGGIFKYDRSFVSYFLTLLLNAVSVAVESPSLRARVYEQRLRIKYEELKKLSHLFSLGPIPDFTADVDNCLNQMEVRRENSASSTNATIMAMSGTTAPPTPTPPTPTSASTTESGNSNTGRTSSPTQSRRRGFSKKLFGVFSSRSGSISSSVPPAVHANNNELSPSSPQSGANRETAKSISRSHQRSSNEGLTRKRSIKSNATPTVPPRPISTEIPPTISLQTPSASSSTSILLLNPFAYHSNENNLINTAALNITTRNRSNSSPGQTVPYTNKSVSNARSKTADDESSATATSSEETDSEENTSEDDPLPVRPFQFP